MSLVLRRDTRKLMRDAENIRRRLEDMLEHDYAAWGNQYQQHDLTQLIENLKRLECDVNTMLSDCTFLGRRYWKDHNVPLINSLHQSFVIMNTLFNDLEEVRLALSEMNINPTDFQQLVIDWGRLKKLINQTQRLAQHPQKRRKNHNWSSPVRQRRGDKPGFEFIDPARGQNLLNQRNRAERISEKYFV